MVRLPLLEVDKWPPFLANYDPEIFKGSALKIKPAIGVSSKLRAKNGPCYAEDSVSQQAEPDRRKEIKKRTRLRELAGLPLTRINQPMIPKVAKRQTARKSLPASGNWPQSSHYTIQFPSESPSTTETAQERSSNGKLVNLQHDQHNNNRKSEQLSLSNGDIDTKGLQTNSLTAGEFIAIDLGALPNKDICETGVEQLRSKAATVAQIKPTIKMEPGTEPSSLEPNGINYFLTPDDPNWAPIFEDTSLFDDTLPVDDEDYFKYKPSNYSELTMNENHSSSESGYVDECVLAKRITRSINGLSPRSRSNSNSEVPSENKRKRPNRRRGSGASLASSATSGSSKAQKRSGDSDYADTIPQRKRRKSCNTSASSPRPSRRTPSEAEKRTPLYSFGAGEHSDYNDLYKVLKGYYKRAKDCEGPTVCKNTKLSGHERCREQFNTLLEFENHLENSKEIKIKCENRSLCDYVAYSIEDYKTHIADCNEKL